MKRLLLLIPMFLAGAAQGQEPADTVRPVKLTLDFGLIDASGNTNLTTLTSGEHLEYRADRMEIVQNGSVIYGRTEGVTSTEQILTGVRFNFMVAKAVGVFVGGGYERNRFAGLARRWNESAGLSFRLFDIPTDNWMLELGAALNQERSTAGVSHNFTSLRGATTFRNNYTKTTFLTQSFEYLPNVSDFNDARVNSETAIVAPVANKIALKIAYLVKFDNAPEPGFEKTDRIFTSGVQIVF